MTTRNYTVAPCDLSRSFEVRFFCASSDALHYATAQGDRSFVIARPSGAVYAAGKGAEYTLYGC